MISTIFPTFSGGIAGRNVRRYWGCLKEWWMKMNEVHCTGKKLDAESFVWVPKNVFRLWPKYWIKSDPLTKTWNLFLYACMQNFFDACDTSWSWLLLCHRKNTTNGAIFQGRFESEASSSFTTLTGWRKDQGGGAWDQQPVAQGTELSPKFNGCFGFLCFAHVCFAWPFL